MSDYNRGVGTSGTGDCMAFPELCGVPQVQIIDGEHYMTWGCCAAVSFGGHSTTVLKERY